MAYYLNSETIKESFDILSNQKSSSPLFFFLLLKAAGFNSLSAIDLETPEVKDKVFEAAKQLGALFTNEDIINNQKEKFNFFNPLDIPHWGSITESLKKWSTSRFKNNVIGGGEKWKYLLSSDEDKASSVTEKIQGINKIIKDNHKVPIDALAIWFYRFTKFENQIPISQLLASFYKYFHLDGEERNFLFSTNSIIDIQYSNEMINPSDIREWLKNPSGVTNWVEKYQDIDINQATNSPIVANSFSIVDVNSMNTKPDEFYLSVLNEAKQVIFMGAPGTSKSYIASKLKKHFNQVKRVQFHPQYTYQEFIGGKILENGSLKDQKGIFTDFLEKAIQSSSEQFLFIIEEINRANLSQVFGELIQLLDRGESIDLKFNSSQTTYYLPDNLKIIGTMNTTDRTVGRIDYALKRRFYQIHFYPDYSLLMDKVTVEDNIISISDVLSKINQNLIATLNNKEMVIGHAMFFNQRVLTSDGKYVWNKDEFCNLFNYLIEPIIEDYCDGNSELINSVISNSLRQQKTGSEFYNALEEYLLQ